MHQQRKVVGICLENKQVIGSSLKLGSCPNTFHKNADTLLNKGSDDIDRRQLHEADERNVIGDTFFEAGGSGAKRERGNKDEVE